MSIFVICDEVYRYNRQAADVAVKAAYALQILMLGILKAGGMSRRRSINFRVFLLFD